MNNLPFTIDEQLQIKKIAQAYGNMNELAWEKLFAEINVYKLNAGEHLWRVGDINVKECFVLSGILRSYLHSSEGQETTLDFYVAPCVLSPAITRSNEAGSRVHCEALSVSRVAVFSAASLNRLMKEESSIGCWANQVLMTELVRRANKEIALATQNATTRLKCLLEERPALSSAVAQHHLASYLGITPVSLSRLRSHLK